MDRVSTRRKAIAAVIGAGLLRGIRATAGAAPAGTDPEPTRVQFDPANFVDPTTSANEYHPLRPGMQWVRAGTTEVGSRKVPHQVISTMTDVMRTIDGVPAVAMLDQSTDSGEIAGGIRLLRARQGW